MKSEIKIVLIDDSEWELFFHQELLHLNEIADEILSFTSAEDALNYFNQQNEEMIQHVILTDIHMPGMNGFEFVDRLATFPFYITSNLELFFLSSTVDYYELKKAKSYKGVNDIFSKPLNVNLLVDKLQLNYKCAI